MLVKLKKKHLKQQYQELRNTQRRNKADNEEPVKQISEQILPKPGAEVLSLVDLKQSLLSTNQDEKEKQTEFHKQLVKDLNKDNISYINSLLKGRSTSQQHSHLQQQYLKLFLTYLRIKAENHNQQQKPEETQSEVQNQQQVKEVFQFFKNKLKSDKVNLNHNRAKSFFEKCSFLQEETQPRQQIVSQKEQQYVTRVLNFFNREPNHIFKFKKEYHGLESLQNSALNSNNTSQYTQINVKENQQTEKLFDQFFKENNSIDQVKVQEVPQLNQPFSSSFLDFLDQQINYHSNPSISSGSHAVQRETNHTKQSKQEYLYLVQENKLLKQQVQKFEFINVKVADVNQKFQQVAGSRKEIIHEVEEELKLYKLINSENQQLKHQLQVQQKEIHHLKRQKHQSNKKCEILQELLVRERIERENHFAALNKAYQYKDINQKKVQELIQGMQSFKPQIVQETVSSLADEKFESNDQSLRSSLSQGSLDHDMYDKISNDLKQRKIIQDQNQKVSTQDISRILLMQQYDSKNKKQKQKVVFPNFEDASNDLTSNSMFSANNLSD